MKTWVVGEDRIFQSFFIIGVGGTKRDAFDLLCRKNGINPETEDGRPGPTLRTTQATVFFKPGYNNFIIWFRDRPPAVPTTDFAGIIAHEAFHGALHIMNTVGMGYITDHNEEAFAYYIGYVTREVFRRFWPVKKEKKR